MRKLALYSCLVMILGALLLVASGKECLADSEHYSLDQAVALVKKTFGGQVLKATSGENEGRRIYRVRVLTEDGRVRTFTVDAQDGLVE